MVQGVGVRLPTVFGPAAAPTADDHGVVSAMVRRALADVPLTLWGSGGVHRDLLFVEDAARAVVAAADHADVLAGRHWLVGTWRPTRLSDLFAAVAVAAVAAAVAEESGRPPVPVVRVDPPDGAAATDTHSFTVDPSRFHRATGWVPQVSLDEGLRRTVSFLTGRA
ncbi:nucleoside-diphosphate-sugar epimerase [Nocardiopsis mwathae]|uniref:Nucleoside-diphosphate-sugar epimerase n=1 Tax=Nocardiopsis mwathae TaxID=1472723 RepID=A0A7X0D7H0_9ACTN|nr:nucleoside-diphosphate-sugar epimerase [Nocardiopsis mwathae]